MASRSATRDWARVDFYAVLGVAPDATDDEVAAAYRALAKQLHPDAGASADDVERFHEVSDAYRVLSDPRRRRDYDHVRATEAVAAPVSSAPHAVPAAGPAPGLKDAPARRMHLTRPQAWLALLLGIPIALAGIAVGYAAWSLRTSDLDERAATVAIGAKRVDIAGDPYITYAVDGEPYTVPEPDREEPGGIGTVVMVRYDPDDPATVIADESRTARDITLAIVALKLLVGGIVFTVIGIRVLRRSSG